ncbi:MAG: 16S rRNA (uracil(1498)-N(3))-methyltransferase, partial [Lachnospiraceae bacterium]|nr:16S rRNA (uracil(1498)-N(3))-methyltransferase [Lachnospiraceae bacterium]
MYQFFVEPDQIQGRRVVITGRDVNHIKNVLRMKPGDEISVSNGADGKEYRCGIEELTEDRILCELRFIKEESMELPSRVYLFQGLPKGDKMELIIQKAVELGVYEIIPVACKRAVVKLDGKKAANKTARWQGIAEAAAKQSRRGMIPQVREVMGFREAVSYSGCAPVRMIPYELARGMDKTRELVNNLKPGEDIAVFIGPEGGFAEEEIEQAVCAGVIPVTLGKRILRT